MVKLEMTRRIATNISVEKALEYCQYNCFDVNRSNPSSLTIDSAISGSGINEVLQSLLSCYTPPVGSVGGREVLVGLLYVWNPVLGAEHL